MAKKKSVAGNSTGQKRTSLQLDDQLCLSLHTAARAITRVYSEVLREAGITYPQYLVLICLLEEDGLSLGRIGERLALDSGTLTPLIKRMERNALVERRRRADDERKVDIWLTKEGYRLRAVAERAREHVVAKLGMSNRSIARLRLELVGVVKSLGPDREA